jgi:hypothetical protein
MLVQVAPQRHECFTKRVGKERSYSIGDVPREVVHVGDPALMWAKRTASGAGTGRARGAVVKPDASIMVLQVSGLVD